MVAIRKKNSKESFVGRFYNKFTDLRNAKTYNNVAGAERGLKTFIFRYNQESQLTVDRDDFVFVRVKLTIDN